MMKAAIRRTAGAENSQPVSVSPLSRGLPSGGLEPRTTAAPPGIAPMASLTSPCRRWSGAGPAAPHPSLISA